jgi:hypothetical protein
MSVPSTFSLRNEPTYTAAGWLALLLLIRELPGPDVIPDIGYSDNRFYVVFLGICSQLSG